MQATPASGYAVSVLSAHDRQETASVPLTSLPLSAEGVITDVRAPGTPTDRLADLGFLPGTRIRALRRAPLGEPVVYELRGYRISLRAAEAARVQVRVDDNPTP